jgi:LAO/AO transport system ATPase
MLDELLARFRQGDRRALARLLSMAVRGEELPEIENALGAAGQQPGSSPPRVIAFTGSAGVGKSTLVGKLIELLRKRGKRVAVLACDPQSPVSGGALLGDRFRMPSEPDDGVFIRSIATAGGHGAVAEHLEPMIHVLECFGFDTVILETVGAGQGDTNVRDLADVVVLLLQPEAGDELQWEKAGVLEVADIIAIQKADLPGAESTEAQVRNILGLSHDRAVPVLRVSARTEEGVESLWNAIAAAPARSMSKKKDGDELLRRVQELVAARFRAGRSAPDSVLAKLIDLYSQGKLDRTAAIRDVLRILASLDEG